jgi:hypothetical protein
MQRVLAGMAKEWPEKVSLANQVSATMLGTFGSQLVYNLRPRSKPRPLNKKRRAEVPPKPQAVPEVIDVDDDGIPAPERRISSRPKARRVLGEDALRTPLQGPLRKVESKCVPTVPIVAKTKRTEQALEISSGEQSKGEQVVRQFLVGVSPNLPLWVFDKFLEFGLNTLSALQDLGSKEEDAIGKVLDAMDKKEKDERKRLPPYQRVLLLDAFRKLPIDLS